MTAAVAAAAVVVVVLLPPDGEVDGEDEEEALTRLQCSPAARWRWMKTEWMMRDMRWRMLWRLIDCC